MKIVPIAAVAASVLLAGFGPSATKPADDFRLCHKADSVEISIDACTRVAKDQSEPSHDRAIALYNRGLHQFNKGEPDQAVHSYTLALELDPDLAEAYNNRGYTLETLKLYDKAIADYHKALALDPDMEYSRAGLERIRMLADEKG